MLMEPLGNCPCVKTALSLISESERKSHLGDTGYKLVKIGEDQGYFLN